MKMTVLKACKDPFEANVLKSMLKDKGITCFLSNENIVNLFPYHFMPPYSGIQIFVEEHDLDLAEKIIGSFKDLPK